MNKDITYVIETVSGARFGNCLIGSGKTEKEAWLDAYGPKPWTPYVKQCAKNAWVREVTAAELYELECQALV